MNGPGDGDRPDLLVCANRVGYLPAGPKVFLARSPTNAGPSLRFALVDGSGGEVAEGLASRLAPRTAGPGPFWYLGDFSGLRASGGEFRVRVEAGGLEAESARFCIGGGVLWRLTKPAVVGFMSSLRAERAEDGLRVPPEAVLRCLWGLVLASEKSAGGSRRGRGSPRGAGDGRPDPQVRRELAWCAEWLRELARAGDAPDGRAPLFDRREPELGCLAGYLFAGASEALGDVELLRRGERLWERLRPGEDLDVRAAANALLSETALHVATLEPGHLVSAERRAERLVETLAGGFGREEGAEEGSPEAPARAGAFPEAAGELACSAAALAFFAKSLPQHPLTPRLKEEIGRVMNRLMDGLVKSLGPPSSAGAAAAAGSAAGAKVGAPVPFLLMLDATAGAEGREVEGGPGAGAKGLPARVAELAWAVLAAHGATGRPSYVALAGEALGWLLGINPSGVSLVRGAGSQAAAGEAPGAVAPPGADLGDPGALEAAASAAGTYLMAISLL